MAGAGAQITVGGPTRIALAIAAGLALADASVVVLALPQVLTELDASVEGVAAVIGAYTITLSVAALVAVPLRRRLNAIWLGRVGILGFAAFSAACGLAGSMPLLIALRAAQGLAGAAVLLSSFQLLAGDASDRSGRRLWNAAALLGAAFGPALGGALTELSDWRAIFLAPAPVALVAALMLHRAPARLAPEHEGRSGSVFSVPAICLALLSAALTGVLFLVVLLLISGWALAPLEAAAVVSIVPVAAIAGMRVPGGDALRAVVGCALVGAGVLSLAFLALDTTWMTVAPQVLAGLGMGMALPALAGGLHPERSFGDAAHLLAVRHLGVTLALAILAPVVAGQMDSAAEQVRLRGTALILDAKLPTLDKLEVAGVASADLDAVAPRAALQGAFRRARAGIGSGHLGAYDRVSRRTDETLVEAVDAAFSPTFLICGGLGLLAALGLAVASRPRYGPMALAACAVGVGVVPAQAAIAASIRPAPVRIADPCHDRAGPGTGGVDGLVQDAALDLLDETACSIGSSREELTLAIADKGYAGDFEARYGVDPRSPAALIEAVLASKAGSLASVVKKLLG